MLLLEIAPLQNRIFVLLPYKIFLAVTEADMWIIPHKNEINEIDVDRSFPANLELKVFTDSCDYIEQYQEYNWYRAHRMHIGGLLQQRVDD